MCSACIFAALSSRFVVFSRRKITSNIIFGPTWGRRTTLQFQGLALAVLALPVIIKQWTYTLSVTL